MLFPLPPFPQTEIFFIHISSPAITNLLLASNLRLPLLTYLYTPALHDAPDDPVGLPFPVEKRAELPQLLRRHGDEQAARGRRTCAKGSGPILDAQPVPLANAVKRIFSISIPVCKPPLC